MPVLAFLHENPDALPRQNTDTENAAWTKLQEFRKKLKKKHTLDRWTSASDLKAKVIVSLTREMKRRPAVGWVRADQVPTGGTLADVLALKNRVAELEEELHDASLSAPRGTEGFEQGDDQVLVRGVFNVADDAFDLFGRTNYSTTISLTWNEIFAGVAPTMISETSEEALYSAFRKLFAERSRHKIKESVRQSIRGSDFSDEQIETCIVQFRALGLIRESVKKRSVKDTNTYWKLTPWGDHLMTTLRAIRKATK